MKRAVLCVANPQDYIPRLNNYSIMIVNPVAPPARTKYLLDRADWSLLITDKNQQTRDGQDYGDERVLWYTSGTTGDSKFCSFTQEQVDILANKICKNYDITANDRYVNVMSLWHAHGQGFYWATQLAGCERHFLSIKDIRKMINNVNEEESEHEKRFEVNRTMEELTNDDLLQIKERIRSGNVNKF